MNLAAAAPTDNMYCGLEEVQGAGSSWGGEGRGGEDTYNGAKCSIVGGWIPANANFGNVFVSTESSTRELIYSLA